MDIVQENAAYALTGTTLKNGWLVKKIIEPKPGATGGNFSVCYIVTRDGQEAFLKALNFIAFFNLQGEHQS